MIREEFFNMLLLMPFGFLVPLCFRGISGKTVLIMGSLISLIIETAQLVTKRGVFELDDLLFNTMGVMIGYLIIKQILRIKSESHMQ